MSAGNSHNGSPNHADAAKGGAFTHIWSRKWSFLGTFILVLIATMGVCMATGFLPNPPSADISDTSSTPATTITTSPLVAGPAAATDDASSGQLNMSGELPTKIVIPTIKLSATVAEPDTLNVDTLNDDLEHGAVRYPTSATLGQPGNMILFGHSSYLPIVHNLAYKTFDGIQNLKQGDQIDIYSDQHEYVYSVATVQKESANSDAIPLTTSGYTLTLSTCDSFGVKTDRFIVTATLVGTYALGS